MHDLHKAKYLVPPQLTRPCIKRPREINTLVESKPKTSQYEQHVDKTMQVKQIEENLEERHYGQSTHKHTT